LLKLFLRIYLFLELNHQSYRLKGLNFIPIKPTTDEFASKED